MFLQTICIAFANKMKSRMFGVVVEYLSLTCSLADLL